MQININVIQKYLMEKNNFLFGLLKSKLVKMCFLHGVDITYYLTCIIIRSNKHVGYA